MFSDILKKRQNANNNQKTKIFLVDDEPVFLEILKQELVASNLFEVITFSLGEDCLKNLHLEPQIVILDFYLNKIKEDAMDGMGVLKEIVSRTPSTKVIILSGQKDGNLVYELNKEKAFGYIVKDDDVIENTLETIKDALE